MAEKGKFLADAAQILIAKVQFKLWKKGQYLFFQGGYMGALCIMDVQAMSPGKLTFDGIYRVSAFVINIIAAEPREKSLFE